MMTLKRSPFKVMALFTVISILNPIKATADVSSTPTTSATPLVSTTSNFSQAQSVYKSALDSFNASKQTGQDFKTLNQAFLALQKAYKDQLVSINQSFKSTALAARNNFQSALPGAKTAAARAKLRADRDSALLNATLARDNAVAALGTLPPRPEKPVKTLKPSK